MQGSSNIHSIKYLSSGLQGSKNVFHLDFSLHHFTGYHQSSAFLTGKFLEFSSLFCMEVISTLIIPDHLFHLHYTGFEILTSVADLRFHILCAICSLSAVSRCIYSNILIQIRSVAWVHISWLNVLHFTSQNSVWEHKNWIPLGWSSTSKHAPGEHIIHSNHEQAFSLQDQTGTAQSNPSPSSNSPDDWFFSQAGTLHLLPLTHFVVCTEWDDPDQKHLAADKDNNDGYCRTIQNYLKS